MVKRVPAARELIGVQSEDSFEVAVIRLARLYGWCGYHVRYSVASTRGIHLARRDGHMDGYGWPDWCFVRDRILYRELKTNRGRLTPDQKRWAHVLANGGADVRVWRPRDLEEIVAELSTPLPIGWVPLAEPIAGASR